LPSYSPVIEPVLAVVFRKFQARGPRMTKIPWAAFIGRHPAAHLVAGIVPERDAATARPRHHMS
jgi:hypothetical protein